MIKEGYLYETHMHTSQGSACGKSTGAEMARAYKAAGYTGIIITDHFFYGNTAADRSLPWAEWVEQYCKGYEDAKAEGDKIGLQVFFGWESGYHGPEFLVYGLDKQWLINHPEIRDCSVKEQMELVHADGGVISQAHPFREAGYINGIQIFPYYIDAVEGYNASHTSKFKNPPYHHDWNDRAVWMAKQYGDLPLTAGSDQHDTHMLWGGMVFPRKLEDIHDFGRAVKNKEYIQLLNGTEKEE